MAAKPLEIKDWQQGIGESPYTGFAQMVNVDPFSLPGSLRISNRLANDLGSVGVVTDLIKWTVQDPADGSTYHVDASGKLYHRDTGGTWSVIVGHGIAAASGEGLAIWQDYLFYARQTRLDVYALPSTPNADAGTWYNDWQVLESSFSYDLHPMLRGQSSSLFVGNAQYIDRLDITITTPFDPGNILTFAYSSQALPLSSEYRVVTLEEYGTSIAIGTIVGSNSRINIADMFFWDGFSEFVTGNSTIHFAENGIQMNKNLNNILYTVAGRGNLRLFASATSQAQEVKRFNNINMPPGKRLIFLPDSIDQIDGELVLGAGQSGGTQGPGPLGIYSYRNNAYVLRYLPSTESDGTADTLKFGSVRAISAEQILVAWQDNTNTPQYGVDVLGDNFYSGYTAYVESPLYHVGTDADPRTFEKVEIIMGRQLNAGDGVRIKARKSLDEAYTTIATFDTTTPTYLNRYQFRDTFGALKGFVDCQFRIELTTAANSTVSPELREVSIL